MVLIITLMEIHARRLKKLGEKVKNLRKQHNLTQEELAAKIGVSPAYIGFIEQGIRTPSVKTADKLARVLGTKLSNLFD